jgi:CBS domain containing-hemolysin-like protein
MDTYVVPSLIIVALILINGLFVAAEFAIIGVRPTRIAQLAEAGDRTATSLKRILDDPRQQDRYLATAQIGITLASLGLGMYGESTVAHWIEVPLQEILGLGVTVADGIAVVCALALMTFAHVVVGEMVPKSLALQYAERTAVGIAGTMRVMQLIFAPAVFALNAISNAILRLLGIPATVERRRYSPEELELVVAESAEGGLISDQQERLLQNIFDFGERHVSQVMTPRPRITALPIGTPPEELPQRLAAATRSRLVVYRGDLDHIVGVVLIKEAIKRQIEQPGPLDLQSLIRPMQVVPETAPIGRVLAAFKRDRAHIALVIDEYGGTAGVVTLEDLVEEVVGEVHDEFDGGELPRMREVEPGVLLIRGDVQLDDLCELIDLDLPETLRSEVETVGGLVVTMLGRPAEVGDTVKIPDAQFHVVEIEGLAVRLVRLVRLSSASSDERQPPPPASDPAARR